MCKYCSKLHSLYWESDPKNSSIREVYIELDGNMTIVPQFGTDIDNESNNGVSFEINYCPMCGVKLN